MKLTSNWRQEIEEYFSIQYIEPYDAPNDALWCTRCSADKSNKIRGKPIEIYTGQVTQRFCSWAETRRQTYGVLSDKLGIVMNDEIFETYDTHPGELTEGDKIRLGEIIGKKVREREFNKIIFYNTSPLMSRPYFEMLAASELEVYYITKLPQEGMVLF